MSIIIFFINSIIMFFCLLLLSPYASISYILISFLIIFFLYDGMLGNLIVNIDKLEKYIQIKSNEQKKIIVSAKLMVLSLHIGIIVISIMIFGSLAVIFLALLIVFGYFFFGRSSGMSLSGFFTIFDIAKNCFIHMNNYLKNISLKIILTELKIGLINYDK